MFAADSNKPRGTSQGDVGDVLVTAVAEVSDAREIAVAHVARGLHLSARRMTRRSSLAAAVTHVPLRLVSR